MSAIIASMNRMGRRAAVAALALAMLVASSCSGNVVLTMVPSPVVMQDERLDFSRDVLPESRGTEVSVLFATTRAPAHRRRRPNATRGARATPYASR
jgi:hypothetical protein